MIIPFANDDRKRYFDLLNKVFDSNFWSEGEMVRCFEEKFGEYASLKARAVTNGGTGLLAILEYLDVKDKEVIVPANTFWATVMAAKKAGAKVVYADCNKEDLCLSYEDMVSKVTPDTKTVIVVHIGGHIAFDIEKIAEYCEKNNIFLVEDCAHAHGADWNGKSAGSWGFAGSYSFYATKSMPTGEGGMVVSRDEAFLEWLGKYRNYGKEIISGEVTYPVRNGFNYRMSEFVAALGIVQLERLPGILRWKSQLAEKYDQVFEKRVQFPEGMTSGYYKYIVFDYPLKEETGKVFARGDLGPEIDGADCDLPNTIWVAGHHRCVPIYYGWERADLLPEELKDTLL